jgi:hypothetical protein
LHPHTHDAFGIVPQRETVLTAEASPKCLSVARIGQRELVAGVRPLDAQQARRHTRAHHVIVLPGVVDPERN